MYLIDLIDFLDIIIGKANLLAAAVETGANGVPACELTATIVGATELTDEPDGELIFTFEKFEKFWQIPFPESLL